MRSTKYTGALTTAAALSLVLAACSGDSAGDGGTTESTETTDGGGEGGNIDINATPREEMQQGGTLRRIVTELPDQWNPMQVNGNQLDYTELREPMGLDVTNWLYDEEGVPQPNPDYLESFDEETTDDALTVTLHLNPDAKWNSGDPIDWEDYRASLTACTAANADAGWECVQTEPYEQIESVEMGETEFDVVVNFKTPQPDWTATLSRALPAEGVSDMETFNTGWLEHNPDWFTGPFKLGSHDTAQNVITLVPNENWWGDEPMLDEIVYRALDPEAAPQAFQNNEVDVFDIGPDPNGYAIANSTPNAVVRQALAPNWRHVTFNSEAGPMTDLEVRQAIVKGIDRAAIAASDLAGLPGEHGPLGNHLFMEGQEGYQDNAGDLAYDPEAAGQQLEDAGYTLNESTGIREKDGQPLQVEFTVLTGVPTSENEGNLIQNQLKEIGVDVALVNVPSAEFGEVLDDGRFQMIAFSWIGTPYPMANIGQIYGDPAQNSSNYANLNNPELNTLITEIGSEMDREARVEKANQADQMIWESVHTLPLYQRPELVATVDNLANFGAFGFSTNRPEDWGYVAE